MLLLLASITQQVSHVLVSLQSIRHTSMYDVRIGLVLTLFLVAAARCLPLYLTLSHNTCNHSFINEVSITCNLENLKVNHDAFHLVDQTVPNLSYH